MAREQWASEAIVAIATDWETAFPILRAVRNTSQHQDERILGRRQGGKKVQSQPVDSRVIQAPGGSVTVLSNLDGNRFGCTMADGHFGEVEVSSTTLASVGILTQQTLDAFTWAGPSRLAPC